MKSVLITLKIGGAEADLKVSAERTLSMLIRELGEALNVNIASNARIQAEPAGRILNNEKTLEEQGICNGALLTII